jgi:glyoxylase-like metal-dependent hydrolase (beta-lactamase superfamily II)
MAEPRHVADGIWQLRTAIVNIFLVQLDDGGWFLVDAGMRGAAASIQAAATQLFGDVPPRAIVLTHGHFDHVGALARLAETWDVPVYAHPFELPHLTGRMRYASPDPTVGGGLLAWSSFLYPRGPSDVGSRLLSLPPDGRVPQAPEWIAVHTPGHTAGHVSLFRERDATLIAGDAVTTTRQESLLKVAMQTRELHGPPAYFTTDWDAARWSAQRLAALRPETLLSGHGQPMYGEVMRRALRDLAERFDVRARPRRGRYVEHDRGELEEGRGLAIPLALAVLMGTGTALLLQFLNAPRPRPRALRTP